jgi:hypothetical protein
MRIIHEGGCPEKPLRCDTMGKWKTIDPGVWKPEEGDSITGVLVNKEPKNDEQSAKYHIQAQDGEMYMIWGSAILDDRMKFVKVGDVVRITYDGQDKNRKGQALKLFKVEVREPDSGNSNGNDSSAGKPTAPGRKPVPVEEL